MKHVVWLALLTGLLLQVAEAAFAQKTIRVECRFNACPRNPQLFQFNGFHFEPILAFEVAADNHYTLRIPALSEPQLFYIGIDENTLRPLLLGTEDGVALEGECGAPQRATLRNSPLNDDYERLKNRIQHFRGVQNRQLNAYRLAGNDEERLQALVAEMAELDQEKINFLDSLRRVNTFFAKIAALNTYLSYFNHNRDHYANEIEYFANEYFRHADFEDPTYERLPWVFETFRAYAMTISNVGLTEESHREVLRAMVERTPAGSGARQYAYGGVIDYLRERNAPNLAYFSERFLEEFPSAHPLVRAKAEAYLARARSFEIGGEAPDFAQAAPDGKELRLSDLRGQVVLVDFWASWCGPCRKENPHVVKLYKRFKDKGFTVLGVSLDQDRNRWLQAIEKDGLEWYHVSDLKGWSNAVAKAYNVTSIPHTLLLDKEGRIIARNLRGYALEEKLNTLFTQ
jgi:peroxiredoxin